ncbi:hypothetical protein LX36DRAFT_166878 [Colletotrichum falcatum]|nr:hypothetical protein LX36DRAFT_166878 [Colletotrichum falcatum]
MRAITYQRTAGRVGAAAPCTPVGPLACWLHRWSVVGKSNEFNGGLVRYGDANLNARSIWPNSAKAWFGSITPIAAALCPPWNPTEPFRLINGACPACGRQCPQDGGLDTVSVPTFLWGSRRNGAPGRVPGFHRLKAKKKQKKSHGHGPQQETARN